MGFALERFIEAVDPDFQCRLCGQVLEEPLCTPCGHVFCARCLRPWAARWRRCPLQCQPLAPGELYRVLPLRSLVQKLRIQCDYRARGCGRSVRLRELAAHVERCDFGPGHRHRRRRRGCISEPRCLGGGNVPARGSCGSAPGVRRGGGGGARRGPPGIRGGSGRGPGSRVLAWRRREKALLVQLWALQGEVQLTARRYQEKFTQYMAHVRNFARDLGGGHGRDGEHKPFTIVLERENDTLGFNIIGGRPNQNNQEETSMEGIYVSKISQNGPADRADGLEIHDKIIEVNGKDLSKATHEEAVEAFRNAKEPIVVQVLRRTQLNKPAYGTAPEVQLMNASTQTDITFEHIMALAKLRPPTPPVPDICPFLLSDSCHSLHPMEHEFYEDNEYLSSLPADADRTEDFEYE